MTLSIIIDTREQRPWGFPPHLATVRRGTLRTGDYALEGDTSFGIERKSLDDFLGTISSGWERFQRELWRMDGAGYPARIIIIEGDYISCCFSSIGDDSSAIKYPDHNHPLLTPQFIMARIASLSMDGVSILFAHNPDLAAGLALSIFIERNRRLKINESTAENRDDKRHGQARVISENKSGTGRKLR